MATRYLVDNAIDLSNAASFRDVTYGASAVLADGDSLFVTEGSQTVSAGLNQSGIDLVRIDESAGSRVNIGTVGAPLQLEAANTNSLVLNKGGYGTWNLSMHIPTLNVRAGVTNLVGGSVGAVNVYSGILNINDQVTANTVAIFVGGGQVGIDYKAGDSPVLEIDGGVVTMARLFGASKLNAGRLILRVVKSVSSSTSLVQGGGSLEWRAGFLSTWNPNGGDATFAFQETPITVANQVVFKGTKVTALYGGNGLAVTYSGGIQEGSPTNPK